MRRSVFGYRHRKTGMYLFYPMGTFKKYGGYVGINPIRELPAEAPYDEIGATVSELLECSGPTGFSIKEIKDYERATQDADTARIRRTYFQGASTSKIASKFSEIEITLIDGQKSWQLLSREYDSATRCMVPTGQPKRVSRSLGVESLGKAIADCLVNQNQ